jgi:hypothetical protein
MFSLLPRCHGECALQKNTLVPVSTVICRCWASLFALIPGQRSPQPDRNPLERVDDRLTDPVGAGHAIRERQEDQVSGRTLDEGADRRPVPGTHDQIPLPVTGLNSVLDLGRPLVDHPHRCQPPSTLQALQTAPTAPTPRRARQRDRRVVDRLVDRLLAQPARRLIGEQHSEFVCDLLRAPAFRQQPLDGISQHSVDSDPPLARLACALPGRVLGVMWPVAAVRVAVATDLAADR